MKKKDEVETKEVMQRASVEREKEDFSSLFRYVSSSFALNGRC